MDNDIQAWCDTDVVCLCFSPCIDQYAEIDELVPERKLACTEYRAFAGGGAINVARTLNKLGIKVAAIYPSNEPPKGRFYNSLQAPGFHLFPVKCGSDIRTNFNVLEKKSNHQFRFIIPAPHLSTEEWDQCLEQFQLFNDLKYIVLSGSLPNGWPPNLLKKISDLAVQKKARLIVDISGQALKDALQEKVFLIKPSLHELQVLTGKNATEPLEIVNLCRQVFTQYACDNIVVSAGPRGAILATGEQAWLISPPKICSSNSVGAGDSLVAGIVSSLTKGESLLKSVIHGVACGTATTQQKGGTLPTENDIANLLAQVKFFEIYNPALNNHSAQVV